MKHNVYLRGNNKSRITKKVESAYAPISWFSTPGHNLNKSLPHVCTYVRLRPVIFFSFLFFLIEFCSHSKTASDPALCIQVGMYESVRNKRYDAYNLAIEFPQGRHG